MLGSVEVWNHQRCAGLSQDSSLRYQVLGLRSRVSGFGCPRFHVAILARVLAPEARHKVAEGSQLRT